MTISASPFSGCDCCGYGFEMFEAVSPDLHWHVSFLLGGTDALYKLDRSDGLSLGAASFADAGLIFAMDGDENFYAHTATNVVRKYLANGSLVWTFTDPDIDQSGLNRHVANGFRIAVDSSYIYLAGRISTTTIRLVKIDSDGNEVWQFNKANGSPVNSISVSSSGTVHITAGTGIANCVEIEVDSSGSEIWSHIDSSRSSGSVCVHDASGNVYVSTPATATTLIGYDSSGTQLFSHNSTVFPVISGSQGNMEVFDGKLYLSRLSTIANWQVRRYSGSNFSTLDWTTNDAPASRTFTTGVKVAVDSSGDVYTTATIASNASPNNSIAVRKKLSGVDGSEIYRIELGATPDSILAICPFVPPGRPPIFI